MDKREVITELKRVSEMLHSLYLSKHQFKQSSPISISTITYKFGSWKRALEEAGLPSSPPTNLITRTKITDDDLLLEIMRLTQELKKEPSEREMSAIGQYSPRPYRDRWGSFGKARQIAYARYGFPDVKPTIQTDKTVDSVQKIESLSISKQVIVPQTYKPSTPPRSKKVQFGEPIDFRGLRFAPINEQGVVYMFGMISRELGFLIESIRTDYPDCEGKRCIDADRQRWEHVRIEFEYQSRNFHEHGHDPENCDLIVCWIHNWEECPVEVLELKSHIKFLPNISP